MIKANVPACPAGCKYCMVNYVPIRYSKWKEKSLYGINKTLVFINPPAGQLDLVDFDLLTADFIGYQGINDPFNPIFRKDLEKLVEIIETGHFKKLVLVSKIPPDFEYLKSVFKGTKKVQLVVSITGLEAPIELVSIKDRIKFVENILKIDLTPLVFIHPYIHKVSKLDWVEHFKGEKRVFFSYKGFRYSRYMTQVKPYIPEEILKIYEENENEEVMIGEEYLLEHLTRHINPSNVVNFRAFIHFYNTLPVHDTFNNAKKRVEKLLELSNVSSSDSKNVKSYAVLRRVFSSFEVNENLFSL